MKFSHVLLLILLGGLLILFFTSCGPAVGASASSDSSVSSAPLSQFSTPSSSSTTASKSSDETENGSDVSMQPNRILALGDPILLNFPSDITVGTQSELDRWDELIGSGKVARIDVCNMNDTESKLSGNIASTIIKTLMGAELGFYDTLGNPMTGGSIHVIAYDSSGAILFQSSYDGEWFSVAFDGENKAYVFNGEGSSLDRLSELLSSAVSESRFEGSAADPFLERWSGFTDLSSRPIDLDGDAIKSFDLNYALGWNFDKEGYQKIIIGSEVGGFPVSSISSSYYVFYHNDLTATAICSENNYYIGQIELMKGILKADGDRSEFYPYPSEEGNNFLFVCERTEAEEQAFRGASVIVLADGREVTVQPVPIGVGVSTDDGRNPVTSSMLEELAGKTLVPIDHSGTVYLEVEIRFEPSSVWFYPFSDGEGGGIWGTRAVGSVKSTEKDIVITDFL